MYQKEQNVTIWNNGVPKMDILEIAIIITATTIIQWGLLALAVQRIFKTVEGLLSPAVQRAFGIIGKRSGEVRRNTALENEIAGGAVDALIGKYKPLLGVIGIDLDDLMSRYTPMELLGALQTFLPMIPKDLLKGDLAGLLNPQSSEQPQSSNSLGVH